MWDVFTKQNRHDRLIGSRVLNQRYMSVPRLCMITALVLFTGAGDVAVVWLDGSETVEAVAANSRMDWQLKRIKATGTTATGMRGYY